MSKTTEISVLTANRLGDGIVVFLDFEGAWSETIAEAVVARSPDEVRALQDRGTYDAEHNLVVEPYLVEVRETAGGLAPIRYRERVRVAGPSILDDVPGYVEPAAVVRRLTTMLAIAATTETRMVRRALVFVAASRILNLVLSLSKDAPHTPPTPRPPDMYRYDEFDAEFVRQRVAQFRDQVGRRLSGELTEDEFKPLRLMNGVYLQLHAYMLRIAIPYGTLSSRQMRKLAHIARIYDRGTGHFTTRQNLQFNWPKLARHPRHPGRAGTGRDARHPDLGQLHPQRHRRPLRRRRRRRGRRSAALCRDHPPVVVAASRVQLPAAQVQGRGDGRRARPRRHPGARHRPAAEAPAPAAGSALPSRSAAARAARPSSPS